jgi:signal peptidase I
LYRSEESGSEALLIIKAMQKTSAGAVQQSNHETPLESFASLCGILAIGLFILTFIFQNYVIPTGSMIPTILIGDHALVDRITFEKSSPWFPFAHHRAIHDGDIIVFIKPGEPKLTLVKRVMGVPGDRIHLQNGTVYRNGKPLQEPQTIKRSSLDYQLYRDNFPSVPPSQAFGITPAWAAQLPSHIQNGDLIVPLGHYFAMGDNRPDSLDSRYWGFVPKQDIIGRPLFVYWSFKTPEDQVNKTSLQGRAAFAFHVITHFFSDTRWNRAFHILS